MNEAVFFLVTTVALLLGMTFGMNLGVSMAQAIGPDAACRNLAISILDCEALP